MISGIEMKIDYLIAGHHIRVEGEALVKQVETLSGFNVFEFECEEDPVCRFILSETEVPSFQKILYTSEANDIVSHFGSYKDGYLFDATRSGGLPIYLWMDKEGHVAHFSGNLEASLLRLACWIAYGVATLPFETISFHTSAIQYNGKAVLFLGESGTGKSTHTRLWRENIPGASLLNDDSPMLRIIDGKPWVYGSPWSGKTPCYKTECYPLAGCVRLSQAPFNQIKKMRIAQAYGSIHPSCPPFFAYDDALYDQISRILSVLLSNVPVYHLACLPNVDAARLSFETIFGTSACEK